MKYILPLIILLGLIGGCTRGVAPYIHAEENPPMKVPEGVVMPSGSTLYDIPAIDEDAGEPLGEIIRPRKLISNEENANRVRLLRLGEVHWLSVEGSTPERVWSLVELYLRGLPEGVGSYNAEYGMIRSGVLEDKTVLEYVVESGLRPLTSEVTLNHLDKLPADASDLPTSVPHEDNLTLTHLKALASFIATNQHLSVEASLLAQNIRSRPKARLIPGRPSRLLIALPFDRLWASLERASKNIEQTGVKMADRDRKAREIVLEVQGKELTGEKNLILTFRLGLSIYKDNFEIKLSAADLPEEIDNEQYAQLVDKIVQILYSYLV